MSREPIKKLSCPHLRPLEKALQDAGIPETWRGKAWTNNVREWVYFECYLDIEAIQQQFALPDCITTYQNDDIRTGMEAGLTCETCQDGVIGIHPDHRKGHRQFPESKGWW